MQNNQLSVYEMIHIQLNQYLSYVHMNSSDVIRYICLGGFGFIIGALFKRYGSIFIISLFTLAFVLALLSYLNVIVVNMSAIKLLLGLENIITIDQFVELMHDTIKKHIIYIIIFIVAAIAGFKLG